MTYYPISISEIRRKIAKKRVYKEKGLLSLDNFSNVKEISNQYGETLTRVDGEIPIDIEITNGQRFLFISYDQTKYSHGIHKYPAKFFPELPRWLIKRYSNNYDLVLDPFSGSATTNIEALLNKRHSIGIDVDPFSRFLARVKTNIVDADELLRCENNLLIKLVKYQDKLIDKKDLPEFPYRDNWFNIDILNELAYIKKIINDLDTTEDIRNFYKICFSSIIRAVSNADDNCTRTVVRKSLEKKVYPSMALTKFAEKILLYNYRIIEFSEIVDKNIQIDFPSDDDARYFSAEDSSIDLAVTSPPYVNAVDYPRTHQLEIYWLDIMNGSLNPLKKLHIGTESVLVKDYSELHLIGEENADKKIKAIFKKDKRRAYIAYKYLYDMKLNFKEVYRSLKTGGRYAVVVGNNTIRGEVFENWKYLMRIAEEIGFEIENYFGSEIIKHFIKVPREERINTDWVIILRK